ncbi:MAG: hypothetical protein M1833_000769 [Piccolia ochrophora]|nr:MAG: hypothetical protein M1833_000769 [Piccolia ochrophora]
MSSGFVLAAAAEGSPTASTDRPTNDEWERVKHDLEESKRRKQEAVVGQQEGGKSLYEVLQANKAAKQDQFEESIRLKNQFRSLDEDEVEFLDAVLESTRVKEDAVKKETSAQLDEFRRAQEEADKRALAGEGGSGGEGGGEGGEVLEGGAEERISWGRGGKKRKKGGDALIGVKLRKTSTGKKRGVDEGNGFPGAEKNEKRPAEGARSPQTPAATASEETRRQVVGPPVSATTQKAASGGVLGLDYGSGSEGDE